MNVAVLGPGGVGGLMAGVLARAGTDVVVVAQESTARTIAERGLSVSSVMFGDVSPRVRACARLREQVDALIVATKAAGLADALARIEVEPGLVLPLLNGLDHLAVLRERFDPGTVLAGTIRVESDRPEPGVILHTSQFLLVDMATRSQSALAPMEALAQTFTDAGVPVRVTLPVSERSEAQVMWSKLVRLNALACTTSAYDARLGEIRSTPKLRADLVGSIEEACAVGRAEGAEDVDPQTALAELELAHDTLGSSMQRDIAAGRPPELDAIPGAILRAASRHDLRCPTIERLVVKIAARAGVPAPAADASSPLHDALAIREAVVALGFDIYEPLVRYPEVVYEQAELEALLSHELAGAVFTGPIRTRSKLAKEAVCRALGYPVPSSFKRVKPRFPGQDLDVYVQQHDNLQVWNEELSSTRRYAVVRVDEAGHVVAIRVAEGSELAGFDRSGTLTSKYQASRRAGGAASKLVSASDTPNLIAELAPVDHLQDTVLAQLLPASPPVHSMILTVRALYKRLLGLVGRDLEYSASERLRGEQLHRLACEVLGLGSYADTGRFPDIVCQALEVKLQTSPTIDLGLVTPDSVGPAVTLSPRLRHCDTRYLVAYAVHAGEALRIQHIVMSTGEAFFSEFQRFGGLVQNRKLQLRLPSDFFQPK